jgi:hypothetical protein
MGRTANSSTGAVRAGGARRRPAWLAWLLGLLALLILAAIIIALVGGGDDDKKKSSGSSSSAASAQLSAGGQPLLPLPTSGLRPLVGKDTVGNGLVVQSIVEGQGFWVGTSQKQRVYIEYGAAAGKTEAGYHPSKVGERVDLDGPVRPAPADPAKTLKLTGPDAALVKTEGAYINANKVSPAK